MKRMTVAILPLGNIPAAEIEFAVKTIHGMKLDTKVLPEVELPSHMCDNYRRQWDADMLLDYLFQKRPDDCERIIGILAVDMFAAGRTFVFGYAHLRDGMAVYSIARLREEWYCRKENVELQQSRSFRCIVHELGHTFGNPHCEDDDCIMHAVSQVDTLDELAEKYCETCEKRVKQNRRKTLNTAEGLFRCAGSYLRRRQADTAAMYFRRAIALNSAEARYHNDLGVALLSAGNKVAARLAFRQAVELDAHFPHPFYNLGILSREYGDMDIVEQLLDEGLKRDSDPIAAHRYVAKLYEEVFADFNRAAKHYDKYVELGGDDPEILIHAAMVRVTAAAGNK